ncbi:transposase [Azospirillum brasilense]|uniref:transposase n=1 Tax=Azospirillum brasilense TaxID=192 RepID=UPI003D7DB989
MDAANHRPTRFSDLASEAGMLLRLAFGRPWRRTEGLPGSLMRPLGLALPVSDHTTFSRRRRMDRRRW